jgi:hypothetical protein
LEEAITLIQELRAKIAELEGVQSDEDDTVADELEAQEADEDESSDDENEDCEGEDEVHMNADSADCAARLRIALSRAGDRAGVRVDHLRPNAAKKAIVGKYNPGLRMDGWSGKQLDTALLMTMRNLPKRKSTDAQRQQMFNRDGAEAYVGGARPSWVNAREKKIERSKK